MNKPRSIIEELDNLLPAKNKHSVLESRAVHVIHSAINLIEQLKSSYDPQLAEDLTKRLIKSIQSQDDRKFLRRLNQVKKEDQKNVK